MVFITGILTVILISSFLSTVYFIALPFATINYLLTGEDTGRTSRVPTHEPFLQ